MQLTRFDRWLREKFVYETHIYTLRPPQSLPPQIRAEDLPDEPGKRFKHRFITSNSRAADELIQLLKSNSQMFSTQIVDRHRWYTPIIAPQGKSFTWSLISAAAILTAIWAALPHLKRLIVAADLPGWINEMLRQ
jgi:hypothetical protein